MAARTPSRSAAPSQRNRRTPAQPRAKRARSSRAAGALRLGSTLTIAQVGDAGRAFDEMLAQGVASVDARGLESIDTAGLQWLLVAARAARQIGPRLRIAGGAPLLAGAAAALGLAAELTAAAELSE